MTGRVDTASEAEAMDVRTAPGLDPMLRGILIDAQSQGLPKLPDVEPVAARAYFEEVCRQLNATQPVSGNVRDLTIEGADGPLVVRLYEQPDRAPDTGVILFFHGGGWVLGSLDTHDPVCRQLSLATGWPVLSVDYRLAPEQPFPAALDDARASLSWLRLNASNLRVDAGRIVVAGDSAGGNIAAALTLDNRDNHRPSIFGQLLIYPVVSDQLDTHSMHSFASGFGLEQADMAWFRDCYVGSNTNLRHSLHCPLYAEALADLPQAVVVTAGFDPLHDEGAQYADRLSAAGTVVDARNYAALNHGFLMLAGIVPEARKALDEILELARRLCWRPVDHG